MIVDSSASGADNRTVRDFAYCSGADDRGLFGTPVQLQRVVSRKEGQLEGPEAAPAAHGRWIGLLNVSRSGAPRLKRVLAALQARADFDSLDMPALLNALVADGAAIDVQYVHGHWRGVNDLEDLHSAVDFAHAQAARFPMLEAREFVEAARSARLSVVRGSALFVSDAVHQLRAAGPGPALRLHGQRGRCGGTGGRRHAGRRWSGRSRTRHRHDAELGARQRGESADLTDLDIRAAAAAHRHLARTAGRPG